MQIRNVSDEEKAAFILKVKNIFGQIRDVLETVETDMESKDLTVQASAVWIAGNLGNWFFDFMQQLRQLDQQKNGVQQQIMDVVSESEIIDATT